MATCSFFVVRNAEGEVISYLALAPARRNERGNMFFIILMTRFFLKPTARRARGV